MLLKVEQVISHRDVLLSSNDQSEIDWVVAEMSRKIADMMLEKGLIRVDVIQEIDDRLGPIVKVRTSTRVYNPDD